MSGDDRVDPETPDIVSKFAPPGHDAPAIETAGRNWPDDPRRSTAAQFQRLMADNGVTCSMSRPGSVWDNTAMASFFSSLKTERIERKIYRTRNHAKADMSDYIERFYNPIRRHSTLGCLTPMDFERQAQVA